MKNIKNMMSLTDKVALVTGGAGHIGYAMAESFAEVGATVFLVDNNEELLNEKCRQLETEHGATAKSYCVDLSDEKQVEKIPEQVFESSGRLDILVNCAAFVGTSELKGWATAFEKQQFDTWRDALEVNLTAPVLLIQKSADFMRKTGNGSVINIGSTYGVVGPDWRLYEGTTMGQPAAYGASKGGLIHMTRWLSTVLAPEIRVNCITPGGVWRNQPDSFHEKYVARTPMKRMAKEEDFKGAAVFLASDLSAYVTGHNLVVDGGWTAW